MIQIMQLKIKHFWALFFYWYYSKDLQIKKRDNKGIRLIKKGTSSEDKTDS